jgi:ABC-2 type transport system permease protein
VSVLFIAANNLRRLVRDRGNLFFVFVLPVVLILVLGVTVGGRDDPRIGVHVEGQLTAEAQLLIESLEKVDGVGIERFDDLGSATDELEREDISALVVVPDGYDDTITSGGTAEIEYRVIPTSSGFEIQSLVRSVVAGQNAVIRAGRVVSEQTGLPPAEASETVAALAEDIAEVEVVTVDADGDAYVKSNAVGFVAAQQLILFVFLMSIVAASALIESRQLGVTQRMMATPATTAQIIAGEGLGRFGVAVVQGAAIVIATALLFGLDWGSWPATAAIIVSFALVATATAMFVGALVTNENQSLSIGLALGLALAALGGCMAPFEVFPGWLRSVAHITPHAWAVDAFTEVIQRGGGIGQIGLELAVLVLSGFLLLVAASISLRRVIVE